ncbi:MAG: hypothetical protein ACJAVK_000251 [Akkermansiaceae bacterium]|jgi:hypothetical protein
MKTFLPFLLSSLITVGGSVSAQQRLPPGPPPGGSTGGPGGPPPSGTEGRPPRGERPPKGERPPRGQRPGGGGPRPIDLGESDAELGSAGIAWYPILDDGLTEAKRTNKPILFMAAASQCGGISGVF